MLGNPTSLYAVLFAINLIAFILVGMDKQRSREEAGRIREVVLFLIAIFFSSLGVLLGMLFFHHKTKKMYFVFGIGLLIIEQSALIYLLFKFLNH